jgi:hypothetical protein
LKQELEILHLDKTYFTKAHQLDHVIMTVMAAVCNRHPASGLMAVNNEAVGTGTQILAFTQFI